MAIDDVVSDYEVSVGNNGFGSIQPASGDEWLVTAVLYPSNGSVGMAPHTSGVYWSTGLWGGNSTASTLQWDDMGPHPLQFFVTNSEYIRINNQSGGTLTCGFSAIKTKD
jgi:hypothetical protein